MTTSIYFDRMAGLYAALINDQIVGAAETYHDAEVLLSSIHEAHHSGMIGGDPLLIEAQRFAERGSICAACEDQAQPCTVCSAEPWRIGRRCPTCGDEGDCPDCMPQCDICDNQRVVRGVDHDVPCPYCSVNVPIANTLILAQCAAVIDSCLGGPVANGGILDELRRVRAELKKAGV